MTSAKAIVLALVLVAAGVAYGEHVASSHRAARSAETLAASIARGDLVLHVPHLVGAIVLDGDMDDPGWVRPPGPVQTGEFLLENGEPARPHSHARLVWGGEYLYMAVLASDEDIESSDAVHFVFFQGDVEHAMDVTPRGVITGSIHGVHVSTEIDGTIDQPHNFDEEWALELAIPFESLGMRGERGENIGLTLSRCDTPKDGHRVCAGWGDRRKGRIVLD
ncbi:MAG TPA: hypothetical protein VGH28_02235 [Polyangiaceae bacterium]|jgi:hypothetical protein